MKQLVTVLAASCVITLLCPQPATACRGIYPKSVKEAFDKADAVFAGKVIEVSQRHEDSKYAYGYYEARVQVRKWWKGGREKEIIVRFDTSTCGAFLKVGRDGVIFAAGKPLFTSALSGNNLVKDEEKDMKELGVSESPH